MLLNRTFGKMVARNRPGAENLEKGGAEVQEFRIFTEGSRNERVANWYL